MTADTGLRDALTALCDRADSKRGTAQFFGIIGVSTLRAVLAAHPAPQAVDALHFTKTHRPNYVTEGVGTEHERTRVKCDGDCDFYFEHRRWYTALDKHSEHVAEALLVTIPAPPVTVTDATAEAAARHWWGNAYFENADPDMQANWRDQARVVLTAALTEEPT